VLLAQKIAARILHALQIGRSLLGLMGSVAATRVVSHLFTGGLAGMGKLPALVGWYIRYGNTAYTFFLPLA
jgi:hypothetical protein